MTCKFQIDLFSPPTPVPRSPFSMVFLPPDAHSRYFLRFLLALSWFPWIDCWGPGLQDKAGGNPTNQPTKTEPKALELFFTLFRIFLHVTETERRPPEALAHLLCSSGSDRSLQRLAPSSTWSDKGDSMRVGPACPFPAPALPSSPRTVPKASFSDK